MGKGVIRLILDLCNTVAIKLSSLLELSKPADFAEH